jgi:hypothetical protein
MIVLPAFETSHQLCEQIPQLDRRAFVELDVNDVERLSAAEVLFACRFDRCNGILCDQDGQPALASASRGPGCQLDAVVVVFNLLHGCKDLLSALILKDIVQRN